MGPYLGPARRVKREKEGGCRRPGSLLGPLEGIVAQTPITQFIDGTKRIQPPALHTNIYERAQGLLQRTFLARVSGCRHLEPFVPALSGNAKSVFGNFPSGFRTRPGLPACITPARNSLSWSWALGPLETVSLSSDACLRAGGLKEPSSWETEPSQAAVLLCMKRSMRCPLHSAWSCSPSHRVTSGSGPPERKGNKQAASRHPGGRSHYLQKRRAEMDTSGMNSWQEPAPLGILMPPHPATPHSSSLTSLPFLTRQNIKYMAILLCNLSPEPSHLQN